MQLGIGQIGLAQLGGPAVTVPQQGSAGGQVGSGQVGLTQLGGGVPGGSSVPGGAWFVHAVPRVVWVLAPVGPEWEVRYSPVVRWGESGQGRHFVRCVPVVRWAESIGGTVDGEWGVTAEPAVRWLVNPGITSGACNAADGEILLEILQRNYVF